MYAQLGIAGVMCCRYIRGKPASISNYSCGCAIDMKVAGVLVPQNAQCAIVGLQMLATYFNAEGWCWGAVYVVPDLQHSECGVALVASFLVTKLAIVAALLAVVVTLADGHPPAAAPSPATFVRRTCSSPAEINERDVASPVLGGHFDYCQTKASPTQAGVSVVRVRGSIFA